MSAVAQRRTWRHPLFRQGVADMLGTSLGTYGLFRLQGIAMRLCMMGVNLLWLGHNLWLGSWGGSLIESVFFVVNIITIYRLHKRPVLPEVPD